MTDADIIKINDAMDDMGRVGFKFLTILGTGYVLGFRKRPVTTPYATFVKAYRDKTPRRYGRVMEPPTEPLLIEV